MDKMVAPPDDRGAKFRKSVKIGTDHEFEMVPNGKEEDTDDDERVDDEEAANPVIPSPLGRLRTGSSSKEHDNGVVADPPLEPAVSSGKSVSHKKSPSASRSSLQRFKDSFMYGMEIDICDDENLSENEIALREQSEKFDPRTEQAFAWLQVCTVHVGWSARR